MNKFQILVVLFLKKAQKKNTDQGVMKSAALGATHTLYPKHEWLHIHTDDSLMEKNGNAGEGIHCKLFSFYVILG